MMSATRLLMYRSKGAFDDEEHRRRHREIGYPAVLLYRHLEALSDCRERTTDLDYLNDLSKQEESDA